MLTDSALDEVFYISRDCFKWVSNAGEAFGVLCELRLVLDLLTVKVELRGARVKDEEINVREGLGYAFLQYLERLHRKSA